MRSSRTNGPVGQSRFSLAVALLALLADAGGLEAQVIRGRLLDTDGATGIGGAMVSLVDGRGAEAARNLTRSNGLFQLDAPASGRYRVRADRIGYATTLSDFVDLSPGDTLALELVAQVQPISLAGIEAGGDRRCRVRPEDGLAVTRVWDEARKALAAAAWTQERGYYRYEMMGIRREMDRENRRVVSEDRSYDRGYRRSPYVSRPAEELVEEGFAQLRPNESVYWAPDAAVLLSDAFLDTHCFRLRDDPDRAPGLIGLAFEPLDRRGRPDISGTLWIDPESSRLEWLDFYYQNLNLPDPLASAPLGGRVEFEALPNGTWIVNSWRIRMPRARVATNPLTGRAESVLDGLTVQGGDVLRVHGDRGTVLEADRGGRIAGSVFDTLQTGLPGARVYIPGTDFETVTGRDGRFELEGLEPGIYEVNWSHPYLERFAFLPRPFQVTVPEPSGDGATDPVQINFAAPTVASVLNRLCRDVERPENSANLPGAGALRNEGILVGQVTDSAGAGVSGVMVRILARDFDLTQVTSLREGRSGWAVPTNATGHYRACWVPVGVWLDVDVALPGEDPDAPGIRSGGIPAAPVSSSAERIAIPADDYIQRLDLRVGRP